MYDIHVLCHLLLEFLQATENHFFLLLKLIQCVLIQLFEGSQLGETLPRISEAFPGETPSSR